MEKIKIEGNEMMEKLIPVSLSLVAAGLVVWTVGDKYDFEREK